VRLGLLAEDGGGDQRDDEADGEGFYEGVEGVDEGVLIELLRVADGGDFGLDGFGGAGCGLNLLDLVSEVAVHEAVEEVEVDDLPRDDVEDAGDEGDANADGEGAAEGDGAVGEIVPVGADAEEDKEEGEDDGGVAKVIAFVAVVEVAEEGDGAAHHDGGQNAGDEAEGEDGLLQCEAPMEVDLKTLCGAKAVVVVMLLGDFGDGWRKIMLWVTGLEQFTVIAPNSTGCECRFCLGKRVAGQFDVNDSTCRNPDFAGGSKSTSKYCANVCISANNQ
jgi:hypothetical protein